MSIRSTRALFAVLALVLAVVCQQALGVARAARTESIPPLLEEPALPAQVLRPLTLGFASVVADFYYVQAIQIFGDKSFSRGPVDERRQRGVALYRMLDYTTDLDPRFQYAYVFGGIVLPSAVDDAHTLNVDEAIQLLKKGVQAPGSDWRVPFQLAYLYSTYTGQLDLAAEAMAEAARRAQAPTYLPLLATRLAAAGGALDKGIAVAQAMAQSAEDEDTRAQYEHRLALLVMERDIRRLEDAVQRFRDTQGRPPMVLADLVRAGLLRELPEEPHGGEYQLDPQTGHVRSSASERLTLPKQVEEEIERARAARAASPEKPQ